MEILLLTFGNSNHNEWDVIVTHIAGVFKCFMLILINCETYNGFDLSVPLSVTPLLRVPLSLSASRDGVKEREGERKIRKGTIVDPMRRAFLVIPLFRTT